MCLTLLQKIKCNHLNRSKVVVDFRRRHSAQSIASLGSIDLGRLGLWTAMTNKVALNHSETSLFLLIQKVAAAKNEPCQVASCFQLNSQAILCSVVGTLGFLQDQIGASACAKIIGRLELRTGGPACFIMSCFRREAPIQIISSLPLSKGKYV